MTSTSFNVGLNDSTRNSSKVLKPPGGGTSDIFGAAPVEQSPRRRTNYLQSSLFVETEPNTTPGRVKSGNDTHNRLFGEVPAKPITPYSLKSKSNLGLGDELDNTTSAIDKNIYSPRDVRRNPVTGDGIQSAEGLNRNIRRRINKFIGNPVTGEEKTANGVKEASVSNGNDNSIENINSNINTNTENAAANGSAAVTAAPAASARAATAVQRSRVPPGGYSSGLW